MADSEISGYQNMTFKPEDVSDWHMKGEWFDLDAKEVKAFKKRKFM